MSFALSGAAGDARVVLSCRRYGALDRADGRKELSLALEYIPLRAGRDFPSVWTLQWAVHTGKTEKKSETTNWVEAPEQQELLQFHHLFFWTNQSSSEE